MYVWSRRGEQVLNSFSNRKKKLNKKSETFTCRADRRTAVFSIKCCFIFISKQVAETIYIILRQWWCTAATTKKKTKSESFDWFIQYQTTIGFWMDSHPYFPFINWNYPARVLRLLSNCHGIYICMWTAITYRCSMPQSHDRIKSILHRK